MLPPDAVQIELGAWVHDLLCDNRGGFTLEDGRKGYVTSDDAAAILAHEAMPDLGATPAQRTIVYEAVKHFGPQWV
jgi:hypothetical protein